MYTQCLNRKIRNFNDAFWKVNLGRSIYYKYKHMKFYCNNLTLELYPTQTLAYVLKDRCTRRACGTVY